MNSGIEETERVFLYLFPHMFFYSTFIHNIIFFSKSSKTENIFMAWSITQIPENELLLRRGIYYCIYFFLGDISNYIYSYIYGFLKIFFLFFQDKV